jgi:hypothetical protein
MNENTNDYEQEAHNRIRGKGYEGKDKQYVRKGIPIKCIAKEENLSSKTLRIITAKGKISNSSD